MKTIAKPKPSAMSPEVRAMIDVRHQAEQRGHFEPLGRLLYLKTPHGNILWPVANGECTGPDVAMGVCGEGPVALLLLGPWLGLPAMRVASAIFCPKCKSTCEICRGEGKKQCEMVGCGGLGTVPGPWIPCPGPNCSGQTGKINPKGCEVCHNTGHIARRDECPMCHGSKIMTCPHCRGGGKVATGKVGGSTDYKAADCAACQGTGWKGAWKAQDLAKFTNASLFEVKNPKHGATLVIGPIFEFGIEDSRSRQTRIFEVSGDDAGDLMVLLVPEGKPRRNSKAYFIGGIPRERVARSGAA